MYNQLKKSETHVPLKFVLFSSKFVPFNFLPFYLAISHSTGGRVEVDIQNTFNPEISLTTWGSLLKT